MSGRTVSFEEGSVNIHFPLPTEACPAATSPAHPESATTASLPRDAPFPMQRSRIVQTLHGDPAASLTRQRAQTWCSLFVAPCAPEGTPSVLDPPREFTPRR